MACPQRVPQACAGLNGPGCPQPESPNQRVFHSEALVTHMVIHSRPGVRYLSRGRGEPAAKAAPADRPRGPGKHDGKPGRTSRHDQNPDAAAGRRRRPGTLVTSSSSSTFTCCWSATVTCCSAGAPTPATATAPTSRPPAGWPSARPSSRPPSGWPPPRWGSRSTPPGCPRARAARRVGRGPDGVLPDRGRLGRLTTGRAATTAGGSGSYSDFGWYPLTDLPANMIDRARVAVRNYAAGARFSTYPPSACRAAIAQSRAS